MSTTTSASSGHAAPKPVESANKAARPEGGRAQGDKPAEPDLFANLLSLLSDTLAPTASPLQANAALDADGNATDDAPTTDNPLAALLVWTLPGATGAAGGKEGGKDGGADARSTAASANTTGIDKALNDTGVDISGMTRVDEPAPAATAAALARAANASRPAFSPLSPGNVAASARAADASAATTGGAATAAPNLLWQRGAPASTDALQQNHAASQAVRSTVALDERFGLAAGSNSDSGAAPALREFGVGAGTGASALGGSSGNTSVVGAGAAADTGSGGGDARQDGQTDAATAEAGHPADASAEADAPTISHWGTQHLRHASLRVGGEGGSADAIDIQLSVKGQEVQVAFQTDNAEARANLRDNASASLADLMQRGGMQLGGVSVGSGQAQGDGGGHGRAPDGTRGAGVDRSNGPAEPASRPVAAPRADGSRPLDVFA